MSRGDLSLILWVILLPKTTPKSSLRILGGRDARIGEYPFAVRLENHINVFMLPNKIVMASYPFCSAAAITSNWTLTARHCAAVVDVFQNEMKKEVVPTIRYGNPHIIPSENDQLSAILKTKTMEGKQNPYTVSDDIALLYTEPIILVQYARISAIDYMSLTGVEVTLIGFGLMREKPNASQLASTLVLDKPLQVIDRALLRSCDLPGIHMKLCVVPLCGELQWMLPGDSGGPVLHASGVVGINTAVTDAHSMQAGDGMRRIIKPNIGVITPVSIYLDWIHAIVSGNEK